MSNLYLKKSPDYMSNLYRAEGLCIGLEIRRDNNLKKKENTIYDKNYFLNQHKKDLERKIKMESLKTKFNLKIYDDV